jgi:hypothetical protein
MVGGGFRNPQRVPCCLGEKETGIYIGGAFGWLLNLVSDWARIA